MDGLHTILYKAFNPIEPTCPLFLEYFLGNFFCLVLFRFKQSIFFSLIIM